MLFFVSDCLKSEFNSLLTASARTVRKLKRSYLLLSWIRISGWSTYLPHLSRDAVNIFTRINWHSIFPKKQISCHCQNVKFQMLRATVTDPNIAQIFINLWHTKLWKWKGVKGRRDQNRPGPVCTQQVWHFCVRAAHRSSLTILGGCLPNTVEVSLFLFLLSLLMRWKKLNRWPSVASSTSIIAPLYARQTLYSSLRQVMHDSPKWLRSWVTAERLATLTL